MHSGSQDAFKTCYRGRRGPLFHAAYMRMGKVLLALRILRKAGISLQRKSILDYGFGAGTFFRYCAKDTRLFGVEQDPLVCEEVSHALRARGFKNVDLQPIDIGQWKEHALLQGKYDVFFCSHVLEHLPDPVEFLRAVLPCVDSGGIFLGLVPVNERQRNPHHIQTVDRDLVLKWADDAGYEVAYYEENDPFLYWAQPLYTVTSGWRHKLAQLVSLDLGLSAVLFGEKLWFSWGKVFGRLTGSKPTQAAFVLRPKWN